jgi:heat shock protein 5
LTRAKFEELNQDLFKKTLDPVKQVMKDSGLDIKQVDEVLLVGGSTRIPKVQQLLKDYFKKEPSKNINPDEAVAYGAAVQAGILSGESLAEGRELLLLDVTPLSLGTEVVGGIMEVIIPRNTAIPTKKTSGFVTEDDNQEQVDVMIFEGERPMVKDNHRLGKFTLSGIPPKPRGEAEMEVTFEIDSNGILTVEAKSLDSGSKKKITIKNDKGRLSEQQIQKMVNDAEKFAEEDARTRGRIDAKNSFNDYLTSASSTIKSELAQEKIDEEDLNEAQNVIKEARKWLTSNEATAAPDEIRDKQSEIEEAIAPIIAAVHGKTSDRDDADYDSEL